MSLSNSQMYNKKESSEDCHFTASHTVEKNSFQASEVILQSVEAFVGDEVIDYGPKDLTNN